MTTSAPKGEVLIVEDEANIADLVRLYLERDGFKVRHVTTGEEALERIDERPPNLVILDIALPGIDGIEVCRRIRSKGDLAVLMLTARDSEVDRVVGLEIGADDYVTKPFSPRELVARVKAILRRVEGGTSEGAPVSAGGVTVWPQGREVTADDVSVHLTTKEFDLLMYLLQNRGIVVSRPQILGAVWDYEFYGGERTVDAHIRTIRKKLGPALPLTTIRGVGYKIEHDR
ncbi:MAG TPA: response regulator transcription factor [Actinomycetota bacterium]|nr:response regulator transcription factor [Actinomycetota bacterium]